MSFSPRIWMLLAAAGSGAILAAALASQYIGGLVPCPLCIWQRWPHLVALLTGAAGATVLVRLARPLALLGALAMVTNVGLGVYHTGIERDWWEGPASCTSTTNVGDISTDQLMAEIMSAPLVRCDEVTWDFLGLSLASLNALASLGLAGLWLIALAATRRRQDSSSASQ